MKLKNKISGEIKEFALFDGNELQGGATLESLTKEWEDYEEPKEYWYIDDAGVIQIDQALSSEINMRKSIGNYFLSREEAEKAVEKLKAWKRLKDKGFRFQGWEDLEAIELPIKHYKNIIGFRLEDNHDVIVDLNTIFGGEE